MALVKLTFDGAINTAKNDAIFNYYLVNKNPSIATRRRHARAIVGQTAFAFATARHVSAATQIRLRCAKACPTKPDSALG